MNPRFILAVLILALPIGATAVELDPCGRNPLKSQAMTLGRDHAGYFVRTELRDDVTGTQGRAERVVEVPAEYFAAEAGATVLYLSPGAYTKAMIGRGEWRGPDPLSTLRAFAEGAGGLRIDVPSPDLWVIGRPDDYYPAAVTVYAAPLNPHAGLAPVEKVGEIERALIRDLPVRYGVGVAADYSIGVNYAWLPEDGPDELLVLVSGSMFQSYYGGPVIRVLKVRLRRGTDGVHAECIWHSEDPVGPLVEEMREDLDGDGVRDLLFGAGDFQERGCVILSGRTGRALVDDLDGRAIAVQHSGAGPKLVAGRTIWPAVPGRPGGGMCRGPLQFWAYDSAEGTYVAVKRDTAHAERATDAASGSKVSGVTRMLAQEVGGLENVREYQVRQFDPNRFFVNPRTVKEGFPARIYIRYETPGYLKRLEEEKQKALESLANTRREQ